MLTIAGLVAAGGLIVLGYIVRRRSEGSSTGKVFLALTSMLAYTVATRLALANSSTFEEAYRWDKIGSLWPFTLSLLAHLAVVFTESPRGRRRTVAYVLFYAPAAVLCIMALLTDWPHGVPQPGIWGWIAGGPPYTVVMYLSSAWIASLALYSSVLSGIYYFRARTAADREPRFWVFAGLTSVTVMSGVQEVATWLL